MSNYKIINTGEDSFTLSGEVNLSYVKHIEQEGKQLFSSCSNVKLTVRDVTSFDSSIVALLLSWQRFLIKSDINFLLAIDQHNIELLLKSYNVAELFAYFD